MKKVFKECKFEPVSGILWYVHGRGVSQAVVARVQWDADNRDWIIVPMMDTHFPFQAMLDIVEFIAQLKDAQL